MGSSFPPPVHSSVYTFEGNLERHMKTLFFVESVQFSCISLAEKLYVTFDNMKDFLEARSEPVEEIRNA